MEHPLKRYRMHKMESTRVEFVDDSRGEYVLFFELMEKAENLREIAIRLLELANNYSKESSGRYTMLVGAMQNASMAFALDEESADYLLKECQEKLQECVAAQIDYNVKEECAKERGDV